MDQSQFPDRLYLYRFNSGAPLTDFNIDNSVNNTVRNRNKFIYGGILELDDANKPYRYKFRLTDHVNRLIRKDSTNISLGLVPANGLTAINSIADTNDQELINYPTTAILNPRGVILNGSENKTNQENGGLKLEIFYTEY